MPLCNDCRNQAHGNTYATEWLKGGLEPGESCDLCQKHRIHVYPANTAEGTVRIEQATTREKNEDVPGGPQWLEAWAPTIWAAIGTIAGFIAGRLSA